MRQNSLNLEWQAFKNRFTFFTAPKYDLEPHNEGVKFSHDTQKITNVLIDTFVNTARAATANTGISVNGRVNSAYPEDPHVHLINHGKASILTHDTMTLALSQEGTVIYSDDSFDSDGQLIADKDDEQIISHTMEQGQLILMDDTLWHSAASYDESWEETPRVNLIIS